MGAMARVRAALPLKAKLFRGLADPSRLAILEALREGPKNVSRIVEATGLSQPNTSLHLDCLWRCGLVERETRGRCTYYWIASRKVARILQAAEEALDDVAERVSECERYEDRRARP